MLLLNYYQARSTQGIGSPITRPSFSLSEKRFCDAVETTYRACAIVKVEVGNDECDRREKHVVTERTHFQTHSLSGTLAGVQTPEISHRETNFFSAPDNDISDVISYLQLLRQGINF